VSWFCLKLQKDRAMSGASANRQEVLVKYLKIRKQVLFATVSVLIVGGNTLIVMAVFLSVCTSWLRKLIP
jgi:hypothetical protein